MVLGMGFLRTNTSGYAPEVFVCAGPDSVKREDAKNLRRKFKYRNLNPLCWFCLRTQQRLKLLHGFRHKEPLAGFGIDPRGNM